MEEAIGKYLSNYNYYPIICHYNRDEYNKLIDNIKSVIRDKKYNNDEYAIIKCDLRGYKNISIYIDTMSNGINNMYTVYPISPKCLTVYYNIEDIL